MPRVNTVGVSLLDVPITVLRPLTFNGKVYDPGDLLDTAPDPLPISVKRLRALIEQGKLEVSTSASLAGMSADDGDGDGDEDEDNAAAASVKSTGSGRKRIARK